MGGDTYSAYNLSRNIVLSSKVVIADAALDPLKVLSLWIDRLGFDPNAALWLKPISVTPEVPRIFSFDIVYLDRNCRVIDSAAVVPGVDIPPYRSQVTSALILPERRLLSTRTQRGDKILLHLRYEEVQEQKDIQREGADHGVSNTAVELCSLPQQTAIERIAIERKTSTDLLYEQFPSPLIYMPSIKAPSKDLAGLMEEELWKAGVATPDNCAEGIENTVPVVEEAKEDVGASTDSRVLATLESLEITEPLVPISPPPATNQFTLSQAPLWQVADHAKVIPIDSCLPTQTKAPREKEPKENTQKTEPAGRLVPSTKSARRVTEPDRPKVESITQTAQVKPAPVRQRARLEPAPARGYNALPVPSSVQAELKPRRSFAERVLHWLEGGTREGTNLRKAKRFPVPAMVAFYWNGWESKPYQIANISVCGCYLHTDHPWSQDTIVRMTLQAHVHTHGPSVYSISVLARVARIDEGGAGYEFVMTDALKRVTRDVLPSQGTDRKALERFLKSLE